MLGEVAASRISTAELEMQTAPAVAAATGGIVLTCTSNAPHVMTKDGLW